MLPLTAGSQLVLRFDRQAVQAGLVNPREVIALIKQGVEVHACANLHAKVYVFGDTVIVGSANVSASSANSLIEACVELRARGLAKTCRRFVESLRGDKVGLEFARAMIPLYRPPYFERASQRKLRAPRRILPRQSQIWLVSLVSTEWQNADFEAENAGWSRAERALTSPDESEIETFSWHGGGLLNKLKAGQRVLMNTKMNKHKCLVSPPGRVLSIRRYRVKKQRKAIVYVEVPKRRRRRQITSLVRLLGPTGQSLGNPRRTKCLRDPELIYALGKAFA
jgi:hypothetical protein